MADVMVVLAMRSPNSVAMAGRTGAGLRTRRDSAAGVAMTAPGRAAGAGAGAGAVQDTGAATG